MLRHTQSTNTESRRDRKFKQNTMSNNIESGIIVSYHIKAYGFTVSIHQTRNKELYQYLQYSSKKLKNCFKRHSIKFQNTKSTQKAEGYASGLSLFNYLVGWRKESTTMNYEE